MGIIPKPLTIQRPRTPEQGLHSLPRTKSFAICYDGRQVAELYLQLSLNTGNNGPIQTTYIRSPGIST